MGNHGDNHGILKGKCIKNNRGVTFVELVVVLAIMVVMTSLVGMGIGMLVNADSKKATKNLYQEFSQLRSNCLSQSGQWYGVLKREDANGQYVFEIYRKVTLNGTTTTSLVESQTLGSRIVITCDELTSKQITDTNTLTVYYKTGSGAITNWESTNGISSVKKLNIKIEQPNGGATRTLTLWKDTGRISSDDI
jgi:prepilin-type N-terminal cleavage/methylation domain-containing protein